MSYYVFRSWARSILIQDQMTQVSGRAVCSNCDACVKRLFRCIPDQYLRSSLNHLIELSLTLLYPESLMREGMEYATPGSARSVYSEILK